MPPKSNKKKPIKNKPVEVDDSYDKDELKDEIESKDDIDDLSETEEYVEVAEESTNNKLLNKQYTGFKFKPIIHKTVTYLHPDNRITSNVMTKFDYTEITGIRARQIEKNGVCYTDVSNITDPLDKAKKEIKDKKCPLSIIRTIVPDMLYEKWHVNEMSLPHDTM
jgi:DNA-directed RNA polymerase I, II, and III subunit RPABC2